MLFRSAQGKDARSVFFALAVDDVRAACDVFHPIWEATGGLDGWVSLEVDPGIAHDAEATLTQADALHRELFRPNAYIKIPATQEGIEAFEECTAEGIPVNVTLIFSQERYEQVVAAYLRGLVRRDYSGGDLSTVSSVASFFVSRLDTAADAILDKKGTSALRGKLGVACARRAYAHFQQSFSGQVWDDLASRGARVQRPLWASTSTKDPAYGDVMYVEELIGPHTVNTMPLETLEKFRDHGEVRGDTILEEADAARQLVARLRPAGVEVERVTAKLENEGIRQFQTAFDALLAGIEERRPARIPVESA